eukprot:gnl/MRDRNA2_/MRDRNA2_412258_c0_seq1.p2 gnl/MRDRNA2_/MRDRNA2_412258_c0~~gnl/MRDRNA2_/MRDRNA2_412258_c0_seq1.p2  ORF type:complete len:114 (+),score=8.90 gnl/MRDRNA2_/MRDRNA2_412258_c0_seq1:25-342(+)
MYERSGYKHVVRIPNGEALQCLRGACRMFGINRASGLTNLRILHWGPSFCTENFNPPHYWGWFKELWDRVTLRLLPASKGNNLTSAPGCSVTSAADSPTSNCSTN